MLILKKQDQGQEISNFKIMRPPTWCPMGHYGLMDYQSFFHPKLIKKGNLEVGRQGFARPSSKSSQHSITKLKYQIYDY